MRNFILTILFAVLCSAGFATSAQDAATDQAQAAAVAAAETAVYALPRTLDTLQAAIPGLKRNTQMSEPDECFDWYEDPATGRVFLVYVWGNADTMAKYLEDAAAVAGAIRWKVPRYPFQFQ